MHYPVSQVNDDSGMGQRHRGIYFRRLPIASPMIYNSRSAALRLVLLENRILADSLAP